MVSSKQLPVDAADFKVGADRHFDKTENCNAFMGAMRWPDGVVRCPTCGAEKITYLEKARLFKCDEKHPR